jgi:L-seryl-tRNA(Ser) seleniumtransferase
MGLKSKWNRRGFLGSMGVVAGSILSGSSLSGSILAPRRLFGRTRAAAGTTAPVSGFGKTGNPYEELGVTTVINCEGTMTMLGGSLPHPDLEAVMTMAGRHFVSIPELEVAAGKHIAEMLKLQVGYTALVTSGAAAAIQSGLAGILTGGNETFIRQLPDLTGMKSEVIIQKSHRNPFDHQLRSTGIKLIEIETVDQLRAAVNERTAMMHFSNFANAAGQI